MFTDLPNLICKACVTINTNIFLFGLMLENFSIEKHGCLALLSFTENLTDWLQVTPYAYRPTSEQYRYTTEPLNTEHH